jgi:Flp pilus assembly protein TadB
VHPLFHTTAGLISLGAGATMTVLGSYVIRQIVTIEV